VKRIEPQRRQREGDPRALFISPVY
jgi:hypothetical protein